MAAVMRIIAALLSGVMLAQAHSLEPIWQVGWAAPIPLLIALPSATRIGALVLGAIAGAGSTAFVIRYFYDTVGIVDAAAFSLCKENKLPMVVFGMEGAGNITRALLGERIGTLVTNA